MRKKALLTLTMMLLTLWAVAQRNPWRGVKPDTSRWEYHLSMGTSVVSGWGKGDAYLWAAPSVSYHANEKLTLSGGFAVVGSLLAGYDFQQVGSRSFVPRKHGTQMVSFSAAAEYRASDRLNLWASVSHAMGWYEPLWTPKGEALDLGVTTLSGGFSYAFSDETLLEMHFHFVHDHAGTAIPGIPGHPFSHPFSPFYPE